jgi:hypothetical protein
MLPLRRHSGTLDLTAALTKRSSDAGVAASGAIHAPTMNIPDDCFAQSNVAEPTIEFPTL